MDFNDTPEQAAFRAEVRTWLAANAHPKVPGKPRFISQSQPGAFEAAKAWQKKKADAGFACLTWPKEYGGRGTGPIETVIWGQEVAQYDEPDSYFVIGIGNCGPAIMHFAPEHLKARLLPRMASAEDVWCQLFSEPNAGSDLAGLRTKAEKVGDKWLINGQKIWTSGAQHSDYGVIMTRTDPTLAKHKGLTMFMIDLRQPGVEVRPIKQADGESHFNEVFFNNAEVPDEYRLGEVNAGWFGALLILMNERLAISGVQPSGFPQFLQICRELEIEGRPALENPFIRQMVADCYAREAGVKASQMRMLTGVAKGAMPGPEAAIGKLISAVMNQEIAHFMLEHLGPQSVIADAGQSLADAHFQRSYLFAPGIRLAGGTDEVMRNIIAEQVLGLPGEPRVDKNVPFNQIPSGNQKV